MSSKPVNYALNQKVLIIKSKPERSLIAKLSLNSGLRGVASSLVPEDIVMICPIKMKRFYLSNVVASW